MTNSTASRRGVVAAGAAAALGFAIQPAAAQRCPAPPRVKGPRVWLDMDQQELDDAYDQQAYFPFQDITTTPRTEQADAIALTRIAPPQRLAYGAAEIEKILFYRTNRPNAPTLIFLHGGAWRAGRAGQASYAEVFTKAGANFATVDFNNVLETGGDLGKLVDQCRRAVGWLSRNARGLGADPARLYLAGHSSGAHLAGCVLIHAWEREGLPRDIIKGAVLTSGMYDLRPVRLSKRSEYVNFTDASEAAFSAQRHLDRITMPMVLLHGTLDTPEFQRQSRDFAAALRAAGKPVQLIVGAGHNHFEMGLSHGNPYGIAGRAALDMMRLPA